MDIKILKQLKMLLPIFDKIYKDTKPTINLYFSCIERNI